MIAGLPRASFNAGIARNKSQSSYPELWDGLVACYDPGLGPQGDVLYDWAGRRLDGTLTNMDPATDWVVGERGYALDFDGTNDYARNNSIPFTSGVLDLTVALWIKGNQSGGKVPVCLSGANSFKQFLELRSGASFPGKFYITEINNASQSASTASTYSSQPDALDGAWHLVAFTHKHGGVFSYVLDGIVRNSATAVDMTDVNIHNVFIGAFGYDSGSNSYLNCQIGNVFIWSRVLGSDLVAISQGASPLTPIPKRWRGFAADDSAQTLSTDPAVVDWVATDATLVPGAVTLATDPAVVTWTANDATLVPGSVTLSTTSAVVAWTANDAGIEISGLLTTTPAIVQWTANNATLVPGTATLVTTSAIVQWVANDATIPGGPIVIETTPAIVQWVANGVTLEVQYCPVLKGCRDNPFSYSIENPEPTPVGENCRVLSGCTDNPFRYSIE